MTKWYVKFSGPHGTPTMRYEECFPKVRNQTVCVRRFRNDAGRWFYVPHNWTDGRGGIIRRASLAAVIRWLEKAIDRNEVPCS